ncbi:Gypsy retrotransposon integrase-like protein 1 [Elysia marginata]|uniref:Gypsy retrotransposon integrase-like protein 1 n=1 Tax=Elysia marginata TaxID=1093978 RepID=A0AAV4GE58_9GAST|nr:Gypsy retrotransposon integrase-like protein 1 [Elysia marginata]
MNDSLQFVKSCDTCQRTCNRLPRLPVQQADMIDKPFDKVAIDVVGPLPMTESKCRYILTLVDMGTRWPEALPLKEIRTSDVVSGLFTVFSRLGVPKQILPDNGKQLISEAMTEVMKMLGIERRTCTPYHAQANGMVERLNGSLKTMLKKLTKDKPSTWDKLLPAVLFAYREIPNTPTGYPPFTLMYGRQVRGPADILADICSGKENMLEEFTFIHEYSNQLKEE